MGNVDEILKWSWDGNKEWWDNGNGDGMHGDVERINHPT